MRRSVVAVTGLLLITAAVPAQEHKVTRDQLPPAVTVAVDRETQGSTIKAFSTEREHGKQIYEAETVVDGRNRDLSFAANGTLEEVEEEVAFHSLPQEAQAAITARANGAQTLKVEALHKQGKLVAYEATTIKAGKKGEVQVGPHGEHLQHAE